MPVRRRIVAATPAVIAVLITVLVTAPLVAGCGAAPPPPAAAAAAAETTAAAETSAAATPSALPPGVRWPAAGALFGGPPGDLGDHYCSASVVDTPAGDVVLTAAHCVADGDGTPARVGMSFVPGYHDGIQPYGIFTVTASLVDDAWLSHADPDHDFAFLTVQRAGAPPVETVTGGYHLVLNPDPDTPVDALGYPDFADTPTERSGTTTRYSATQLRLDAHGLFDGTSGGPWLAGPADTDVIGVTGGHEQGGLDPETSYAAYLGDAAAALFAQVDGRG